MLTWQEVIRSAENTLARAGIEDARSNGEYLAMHVLGIWKKPELRERLRQQITIDQAKALDAAISRRLNHEPLQYIIGETEFFGLRLYCSPAALIPRAETEIVVEEAIKEALEVQQTKKQIRILDIGTGSGAIILAMASKLPGAECIGIDISTDALQLAEKNKQRLNCSNVQFHCADFMKTEFDRWDAFDIIISNPPYSPSQEMDQVAKEVREFEPMQALTDMGDGFSFYRKLASVAPTILNPNGSIIVETEYKGAEKVKSIFSESGLQVDHVAKDLLGHDRAVVAHQYQN
ncbi:MAG TPA: peptide chain release factor N(5)-glutamine methyltransferase [Candidatus Kapabacteria bacterium]|nr:peptide chain release factor N(5)-glutamine methyltransferase [Candidatus Kapabacteria bacterium]